jgi:hypothetical protein
MTSQCTERLVYFKRAAEILSTVFTSPPPSLFKQADQSGCLSEFERLCEEMREFLSDEDYLGDLAWSESGDQDDEEDEDECFELLQL